MIIKNIKPQTHGKSQRSEIFVNKGGGAEAEASNARRALRKTCLVRSREMRGFAFFEQIALYAPPRKTPNVKRRTVVGAPFPLGLSSNSRQFVLSAQNKLCERSSGKIPRQSAEDFCIGDVRDGRKGRFSIVFGRIAFRGSAEGTRAAEQVAQASRALREGCKTAQIFE